MKYGYGKVKTGSPSRSVAGRWEISQEQIKEFEDQIRKQGGIDYAALCIDCLPESQRAAYLDKLERTGQTTRSISRRWRESK